MSGPRRLEPRGALVVIEGIDGCGKSTQARMLAERLRAAGLDVVTTREPTDGEHGRRLRTSAASGRLAPREELDLFVADRREHVRHTIAPALAAGRVVIVDRYYFSTAAYQGARGIDPDEIVRANEAFAPVPDLLVLLDVPVARCLERIAGRGGPADLFEAAEELRRVQAVFDRIDRPFALRVDGSGSEAEVHERIVRALDERVLARRGAPLDAGGTGAGTRSEAPGR
jgi:dTMP kinase